MSTRTRSRCGAILLWVALILVAGSAKSDVFVTSQSRQLQGNSSNSTDTISSNSTVPPPDSNTTMAPNNGTGSVSSNRTDPPLDDNNNRTIAPSEDGTGSVPERGNTTSSSGNETEDLSDTVISGAVADPATGSNETGVGAVDDTRNQTDADSNSHSDMESDEDIEPMESDSDMPMEEGNGSHSMVDGNHSNIFDHEEDGIVTDDSDETQAPGAGGNDTDTNIESDTGTDAVDIDTALTSSPSKPNETTDGDTEGKSSKSTRIGFLIATAATTLASILLSVC